MHCLLTFTCVITSGIQSGLSVRASSCQPSFIHMDFLGTRLVESEFMVVGVVFSVSRVEPAGSLERGLPWRRSEEETGFVVIGLSECEITLIFVTSLDLLSARLPCTIV